MDPERPTTDRPLNGPRKGPWRPALYLLILIVVLVALYWFGVTVLVPSD